MRFTLARIRHWLSGSVVRLRPKGRIRGYVLLSYTTLPFLDTRPRTLDAHTNRWECKEIARLFVERGYAVDVIDWMNTSFKLRHTYTYVIDIGTNLERLKPVLPTETVTIYHATGAYWEFQNAAEYKRLEDAKARRGVTLSPQRIVQPSKSAALADIITLLGNDFTESTYSHLHKEITRIPLSTTHTFPSPHGKYIDAARTNFIWLGGSGSVHKGLDLTLEAFARMPHLSLTVCGKIDPDFAEAYKKELYETPNITVHGWMDPGTEAFTELCSRSIALIHPSCSEGQSGAVILSMHAGLIPIVSYESGVSVSPFGIELPACSNELIESAVTEISSLPTEELRTRAEQSWSYAQAHHTRELFTKAYSSFIDSLEHSATQEG